MLRMLQIVIIYERLEMKGKCVKKKKKKKDSGYINHRN